MVFLPGPASPVITTVPRLRTAANAAAMTSSVTTPTVISAWSAPTPLVTSVMISCAVSASAAVCVAPNWLAFSRLLQRVDRDDVARAGERRALDRVDADAADPVDHGRVARPDAARVHRGAPSGRHPAADQRHRLERQVVVDLDAGVLGHHRPLGERAEQAHLAEVLAVRVEPERAVRQAVLEEQRAEVAQVGHAAGAEPAVPAGRQERADHVVARLEPADAGADLLDDPRPLVPAHDRVADRDVTGAQVVVGVAQPGRHEPDSTSPVLGRVEVQLDDLPVLAHVPEHRCPGLHATSCAPPRPPAHLAILRPRAPRSMCPAPRVPPASWLPGQRGSLWSAGGGDHGRHPGGRSR